MMETDTGTVVPPGERRDPVLDRLLIRLGVHDDVARIVAATPSLRWSWMLAALAVAAFAAWGGNLDPRLVTFIALVAPILPVLGVAAAYGPWADPMYEMTQASASSGFRVLLLRTIAVLLSAAVLVAATSLLVPEVGIEAVTWVLPALALCATSLLLATFMPLPRASGLVALAWLLLTFLVAIGHPARALLKGPAQLAFSLVAIGASAIVVRRRNHLEIANLHTRRALVDAADNERRRIERNIHDGAQQQLVAIGVKAGLARMMVTKDPGKAIEIMDQIRTDAQAALEGLRDMTRGAYPPILADEGLAAALAAKAQASGLPVSLDAAQVGRLPKPVEIAVYLCCSEALQNAAKYAKTTSITVTLRNQVGSVGFTVTDDGAGFEPSTVRRGVGMRSMAERVEALGGTLDVRSAPGAGTTISGTIPLTER